MATQLSEEEREQILQTIQMFEMITQTQPDDYQSYDVLKEAYQKLGREEEAVEAARKLADAYLKMGLYSSAMLECEGILQRDPTDAEILALVGVVEQKMLETGTRPPPQTGSDGEDSASLINLSNSSSRSAKKDSSTDFETAGSPPDDHGNDSFAKFLIERELCDEATVLQALETVNQRYAEAKANDLIGPSLLAEIETLQPGNLDPLLGSLIDATRFAYIPLAQYDVDRQIVRMLPEELVKTRLLLPFDLISRTLMIAIANPFDGEGKEAAQSLLDYNIQWFLAKPDAMIHTIKDVLKI